MSLNQVKYCNTTGCRMAYVVKQVMRTLAHRFQEEDVELTVEQYFILNILDKEDGLILQELADIVNRDKSAVLRHIDCLEKNLFVARVTDEEDKRRKLLLVTKQGLKELEHAKSIDRKIDNELMEQIEEISVLEFEKVLTNIYSYFAK